MAIQVLVELAQEREEDIPALVYEARSSGHPRRHPRPRQHPLSQQHPSSSAQQAASPIAAPLQEVTVASASPGGALQRTADSEIAGNMVVGETTCVHCVARQLGQVKLHVHQYVLDSINASTAAANVLW